MSNKRVVGSLSAVGIVAALVMGGSISAQALPASSLSLWAISGAAPYLLYSIDPTTAAVTPVGTGTGIASATAAAFDPSTGDIVVIDLNCDLYLLDVSTGVATAHGSIGVPPIAGYPVQYCPSMTIGADGTGYASVVTSSPTTDPYFVTFDPTTGIGTELGPQMGSYFDWMAFDPSNGVLYGQHDNDGNLYSMDTTTGVETFVSAFSPYSYNVIIAGDGNFLANDYYDLVSGTTSNWTGTVVAPFGTPVGPSLGGEGTNAFFTTSNIFPPTILPATQTVAGTQGVPIQTTAAFTATSFPIAPTYSISPGLPAGLVFDPATGVISGTPTQSLPVTVFTITALAYQSSATATVSLAIAAAAPTTASALAATGGDTSTLFNASQLAIALLIVGVSLALVARVRARS